MTTTGLALGVALGSGTLFGATQDLWVQSGEPRIASGQASAWHFAVKDLPAGQQVRLQLDARVDWPELAGSNPWMAVQVNGTCLRAADLVNKPVEFTMLCGQDTTWVYGTAWRICYAPEFTAALRTGRAPYTIPDCEPYRFESDLKR